jgi:tetratricopeptide (TPR) repeat protein
MTNRRLINSNTNTPEFFTSEENLYTNDFDRFINLDFDYISRMRKEANTFFAITNFNKSIELNSTVIKLIETKKKLFVDLLEKKNFEKTQKNNSSRINAINPKNQTNQTADLDSELIKEFDFSKSKTFEILSNCFNNRGNSYLRNNNFKEAIKDFDTVLKRNAKNVKALFRRAIAYFNLQAYNNSLKDLNKALGLSANEAEKASIKAQIEKTINEINSLVKRARNKSEKYEMSQETAFRRAIVKDIDEDFVQSLKEMKGFSEDKDIVNEDFEGLKQKNGNLIFLFLIKFLLKICFCFF